MPIEITRDDISIRNIQNNELIDIFSFINQSEDNLKALGRDCSLSFEDIKQRYLETLISSLDFFCGIFYKDKIIGFIKGRMESKNQYELYILSFLIIEEYRGIGLGSKVLSLFEEYFYSNFSAKIFYVMIMEDNKSAYQFWKKNGYTIKRIIKGSEENDLMSIIILEKEMK